jgi:hypothetical protein
MQFKEVFTDLLVFPKLNDISSG